MPQSHSAPHRFSLSIVVALLFAGGGLAPVAAAAPPQVRFDTALVVGCRDVTSHEFAAAHPGERLLQADFEISSMIVEGGEQDLIEFVYRFASPQRTLRIIDYQPRTTLASDYAGPIGIEKKSEKTRAVGATVTSGAWDHLFKAGASGDVGAKNTLIERYELVPPMESLAASGSILRGHGVYFKLKASRQVTLEGAKQFSLTLRVPQAWRGDVLQVDCLAVGNDRGVVKQLDEAFRCGEARFHMALHVAGDDHALGAARDFVQADVRLRQLAAASRHEIHRRNYPTLLHELGGLLDVVQPKISDQWLEQLLREPAADLDGETYKELPRELRAAAADYLVAQRRMRELRE